MCLGQGKQFIILYRVLSHHANPLRQWHYAREKNFLSHIHLKILQNEEKENLPLGSTDFRATTMSTVIFIETDLAKVYWKNAEAAKETLMAGAIQAKINSQQYKQSLRLAEGSLERVSITFCRLISINLKNIRVY